MSALWIYILFIALMWWWMSKNNKKRQAAEQDKQRHIEPGVYVMLKDGLCGTVVDTDQNTVVLNISIEGADEGCVVVSRTAVEAILEGVETGPEPEPLSEAETAEIEMAEENLGTGSQAEDGQCAEAEPEPGESRED